MSQGKIERFHRSMKNIIKLQNYYFPSELEQEISEFMDYYNHEGLHESLDNLTPEDVYFGRKEEVHNRRENTKEQTLRLRRKQIFTICSVIISSDNG